jgi:hypothetical protein
MNFEDVTPEDIIGDGIPDRDWSTRTDAEKPCSWHFHVRARDAHACVTGAAGDTEAEAANSALDEFVIALQRMAADLSLPELFGNDTWTYCPTADDCGMPVHVVAMQKVDLTKSGPIKPDVVMFDLN